MIYTCEYWKSSHCSHHQVKTSSFLNFSQIDGYFHYPKKFLFNFKDYHLKFEMNQEPHYSSTWCIHWLFCHTMRYMIQGISIARSQVLTAESKLYVWWWYSTSTVRTDINTLKHVMHWLWPRCDSLQILCHMLLCCQLTCKKHEWYILSF